MYIKEMPSANTFDIAKAMLLSCKLEYIAYMFNTKTTIITKYPISLTSSIDNVTYRVIVNQKK